MNNEKYLKNKTDIYLISPVFVSLVLVFVSIALYWVNTNAAIIVTIASAVVIGIELLIFFTARGKLMPALVEISLEQGKIQKELLQELSVPYALLDNEGNILWTNKLFNETVGIKGNKSRKNIDVFFPQLGSETLTVDDVVNIDIDYNEKSYVAELKRIDFAETFSELSENDKPENLFALYLFDVTELKHYKQENIDQKLVVGLIDIDNYDEVMEATEESRHSLIIAMVDRRITRYLNSIDAIVKKMENTKYFFVFQQRHLPQLKETKFAILSEVKSINVGNEIPVTLSIGIGADAPDFATANEYARVAIGFALARGGDQAVVKHGDRIAYFGGKGLGTEKTTRVKARVKTQAFKELLETKDNVIIMGHKRPDADSFGSAVGVYRLVSALNCKAHIVINDDTDGIEPLLAGFRGNTNYPEDMLVNSTEAISMVDENTLIVVVDVNRPSLTACEELLSLGKTIVIFDHHRQASEYIENPTLSYVEPYASSACEMIAEMLQYLDVNCKLRPVEADAMYAGIVIDTDNFVNKTGVRTFDAASYLRRNGADITRVRKMFRSGIEEFKELAQGVMNSEKYLGAFAISSVEEDSQSESPNILAAKVANELLDVDGVRASFVVAAKDNTVYVSARSVDDVNVQVIMEKLGGGGHANIAGAQLEGIDIEAAILEIKSVLNEMYKEGDI